MDSSEVGFELIKHGNIRIEIHFATATATATARTLTVIVFAEHNNLLEIDQDRNVAFDYTAWTRCKSNACSKTSRKPKTYLKRFVLWISWKNLLFRLLTSSTRSRAAKPDCWLLFISTSAVEENILTVMDYPLVLSVSSITWISIPYRVGFTITKSYKRIIPDFCGHYCVYFILFRCRGVPLHAIVSDFTSNLAENDRSTLILFAIYHNIDCTYFVY